MFPNEFEFNKLIAIICYNVVMKESLVQFTMLIYYKGKYKVIHV
jgi:hypothetical protein